MIEPRFVVRVGVAIMRAKNGPMSRCLAILSEHSEYDSTLLVLQRSAAQPAVRERATRMLLDGYASIFRGYHWRRRLVLAQSINEQLGIFNPAVMAGDINSERVKVFEQRPLSIEYSKVSVLEVAAQDKSPFVRRHVADFLIAHREDIQIYQHILKVLENDQHSFVKSRVDFLLTKLEQ